MSLNAPEPLPRPAIGDTCKLVAADVEERGRIGVAKYGTPLQPGNGRRNLVDAYQECLDLCIYLRNEIEEEKMRRQEYLLELGQLTAALRAAKSLIEENLVIHPLTEDNYDQARDIDSVLCCINDALSAKETR